MKTKHTPGPWEDCNRDVCRMVYAKGYERPICRVDSYYKGFGPEREERDANARLIAAAPDLLAALKGAAMQLKAHKVSCRELDEARAAIAKATGETQ